MGFFELRSQIPTQSTIQEFFEKELFPNNPDKSYHVTDLKEEARKHFNISEEAAELKLGDYGYNGHGVDGTFLDCLVSFAANVIHCRLEIKKVAPNTYAHKSSPLKEYAMSPADRKEVGYAVVSVKLLKNIGYDADKCMLELAHKWSPAVLTAATKKVFV